MTSLLILKIFGIYITVLGLAILVQPNRIFEIIEEIFSSKALTFIAGLVPLILGALLVVIHPVELNSKGIPMVVNVLSLLCLGAGAYRLIVPDHWISTSRKAYAKLPGSMIGIFALVMGCLMLYLGYR